MSVVKCCSIFVEEFNQINIMKTQNTITPEFFKFMLDNSDFTRYSDISWGFRFENENFVLDFFQNESGKNEVGEFTTLVKGFAFKLIVTKEQIDLMWEKLNAVDYSDDNNDDDIITDYYDYYGVQRENFY